MRSKPKIEYITDFKLCDRDHFRILKGISILFVVLAHFCDQYLHISHLLPLQGVAAAVFLFCSGYGVSESFKSKGGLTHYWENKTMRVWLPSLVTTVVFSFVFTGNGLSWVAENPLAMHGWFLYLLLADYAAFWLAFYFLENKKIRLLALYAVSLCAFFAVGRQEIAVQVLCFPTGVLFSQQSLKYPVRSMKAAGRLLLCLITAAVAVAAHFAANMLSQPVLISVCRLLSYMGSAAFLCFGVYFARKLGVFGIFAPLGTISYSLYLLHEGVLTLLKGRLEWRMITAVLIGLIVVAAIFSWLCELLVAGNKKLRRQRKTRLKGSMW